MWLQNPVGRVIADILIPNCSTILLKSLALRTLYELTRISAEFHARHVPDRPALETLKKLESYRTPDPFTGKPYTWNAEKSILYSLGCDKIDNNGEFSVILKTGDYTLYLKVNN